MIWNSSINIKPNPELKKEIKKPSFKASNQCNPKVLINNLELQNKGRFI
jgi:hypothetical protein